MKRQKKPKHRFYRLWPGIVMLLVLTAILLMPEDCFQLLKDRFAALLTDSIRADLLEWQGYKVDVLEFVDFAHSPKNVLIRWIRRKGANGESRADAKKNERSLTALERVEKAIETYHVNPTLYQLLKEKETN